jgi:hypothetical protein
VVNPYLFAIIVGFIIVVIVHEASAQEHEQRDWVKLIVTDGDGVGFGSYQLDSDEADGLYSDDAGNFLEVDSGFNYTFTSAQSYTAGKQAVSDHYVGELNDPSYGTTFSMHIIDWAPSPPDEKQPRKWVQIRGHSNDAFPNGPGDGGGGTLNNTTKIYVWSPAHVGYIPKNGPVFNRVIYYQQVSSGPYRYNLTYDPGTGYAWKINNVSGTYKGLLPYIVPGSIDNNGYPRDDRVEFTAWGPKYDPNDPDDPNIPDDGQQPPDDGIGDPPEEEEEEDDDPPPPPEEEDEDLPPPPLTGIDCIDDKIAESSDNTLIGFINSLRVNSSKPVTVDLDFGMIGGTEIGMDFSTDLSSHASVSESLTTIRDMFRLISAVIVSYITIYLVIWSWSAW